jgi:hypothetical protein
MLSIYMDKALEVGGTTAHNIERPYLEVAWNV